MPYRFAASFITLVGLAACNESPAPNTLTRADFSAFRADDIRASNLDFTPAEDIPTGTAIYEGAIRSDAIVDGEDGFRILGLLELEVDISAATDRAGSGSVDGSITSINLFDDEFDGFDDQEFDGSLRVDGDVREGRIDARATGVLDAVLFDTVGEGSAAWLLNLDGDVVTDFEAGDTVVGNVSGGTTGTRSNDYDVQLTGTGRFIGERE